MEYNFNIPEVFAYEIYSKIPLLTLFSLSLFSWDIQTLGQEYIAGQLLVILLLMRR